MQHSLTTSRKGSQESMAHDGGGYVIANVAIASSFILIMTCYCDRSYLNLVFTDLSHSLRAHINLSACKMGTSCTFQEIQFSEFINFSRLTRSTLEIYDESKL